MATNMFCAECGTQHISGAKFCTKCGQAINPVPIHTLDRHICGRNESLVDASISLFTSDSLEERVSWTPVPNLESARSGVFPKSEWRCVSDDILSGAYIMRRMYPRDHEVAIIEEFQRRQAGIPQRPEWRNTALQSNDLRGADTRPAWAKSGMFAVAVLLLFALALPQIQKSSAEAAYIKSVGNPQLAALFMEHDKPGVVAAADAWGVVILAYLLGIPIFIWLATKKR